MRDKFSDLKDQARKGELLQDMDPLTKIKYCLIGLAISSILLMVSVIGIITTIFLSMVVC